MIARSALFFAALALSGCGPKVVDLAVNVVSTTCDTDLDPFLGVSVIELRVTGPGIESPLLARSDRAAGKIEIPEIPAGPKRVIEVRGLMEGSSPRPLSIGRSLPFDIPDVITDSNSRVEINVFLRKIDSFTPPSSVANPRDCSRMRTLRAAHTATLLPDGRVYLAGGFRFDGTNKVALVDTEFYDPGRGVFEDGPRLTLVGGTGLPRAYHTATMLKNGQVLLYGGEIYNNNTASAVTSVLIFDVEKGAYGVVPSRQPVGGLPGAIARTRHIAMLEGGGRVLIAGGTHNNPMTAVNEIEWYDPEQAKVFLLPGETLPRLGPAGAVVQDGGIVIVAGGVDQAGLLTDEVNFYKFDDTSFVRAGATQHLHHPRRNAAAMTLVDDKSVIVMGGYRDAAGTVPEASSEVIKTATNTIDEATAPVERGDPCAAQLAAGGVLVTGGVKPGGSADGSATLIRFDPDKATLTSVAAAPMKVPRFFHTCTTLADGSVLVTGGMTSSTTVLGDALIYTPIPGE